MIADMFELAWEITRALEGEHTPNDEGSDTWFGIRRANNPDMPWPPTVEQAKARARERYWTPYHFDQLPAALACAAFDFKFNGGPAIGTLQHVLGVTNDGAIGPQTSGAAARCDVRPTLARYLMERDLYYIGLHGFDDNGRGWLVRVISLALSLAPLL